MNNTPKQRNAPEQSRVARRRARVRAELLAAASPADSQGMIAPTRATCLAATLVGLVVMGFLLWNTTTEGTKDLSIYELNAAILKEPDSSGETSF